MIAEVEENLITRKKFSMMVESAVIMHKMGYLDAILMLCEKHELYPEDANKFISTIIKDKLEAEMVRCNYLKGGNTLPL
jgi:hypothetical protein|tara:strand:+ start:407 stop:643 length:237 start_codon:yes stop_codon:yes gene_type:complete